MNSFVLRTVILSLLVMLAGICVGNTYTDNGSGHLWKTSGNWSGGVPVQGASNQWADMTVDGTICIIDSTHVGADAASAGGVHPGCYGGDNELYMTGGELTCQYFNVGRGDSNSGSNGYFQMTGGTINTQGFDIPNQWSAGSGNIVGHVDLHGGVINVTGWFSMGSRISGENGGGIGSMDIEQGVLKINGDKQSLIEGYAAPGVEWITAYGGTGNVIIEYDAGQQITIVSAVLGTPVVAVKPLDDDGDVSVNTTLEWIASDAALSHKIYFGTVDPPPFAVNQPLGDEDFEPGTLTHGTEYFWRIDEVTSAGVDVGPVWSFTTGYLPEAAQIVRPLDDQTGIKRETSVIWTLGNGAVTHEVYFGTDFAEVSSADNPNIFPGRGSFDVCLYEPEHLYPETTYYLRVDERNAHGVTEGAVWSFTTAAAIEGDINFDGAVNMADLRELALNWLDADCVAPAWCQGADISKSSKVDLGDFAKLSMNIGPDENQPAFTDYCEMLSQEIQGKKHGFMAGNLTYYIGGRYGWDNPRPSWYEDETIGLTHPFHHDLRSRGHGMVNDPETGYGHDYQGWEFWKDTKVAYGSVWVGGTKYTNPVPTAMYWQPDKMICEYSVGGITIHEEKFIADNDAACTIITSSAPVTLEFEGQSFANNKTITTTATCQLDVANNAVHIVEGGTAEVKPVTERVETGVMMYDGMSTVISTSRPITDYTQTQVNTFVNGQWTYSFKVPCDSTGVAVVWAMDDSYSVAVNNIQEVLTDPASKMQAKSDQMNDILNYQIPYFRCSDQDVVDIYYYLWSIYLMYYIDVDQGFEQYPHTQSAVNNFLGMHRYDANLQIPVGSWTVDKEAYANGNVLIWSALLPYANLSTGQIPADNMGIGWYSGLWGPVTGHVEGAWKIYEHSGDLSFLSDAYDFYKALMWQSIPSIWGQQFNAADYLAKMAVELGHPEDAQHWYDLVGMDNIDNWLNARWETAIPNWFLGGSPMGWSSMAYMGMDAFPSDWAEQMTEHWAIDPVDGFYSSVPLTVRAMKDWDTITGLDNDFVVTPDTNWWAIRGMYKHHVCKHANTCTLGHLKNYHMHWGIPIAPESFDRDPVDDTLSPWGDQYSNFNAGKISLILEGILGLSYSIPEGNFTVSDHLPMEWGYMETIVPINENGAVHWTKVRTSRTENAQGVEKTISVEGNSMHTLRVAPWLEEKTLLTASEAGYQTDQTKGHIDYVLTETSDISITLQLED